MKGSPFRILKDTEEWKRLKDEKGEPILRRAGVSSFGSGGANAHVVLEEYRPTDRAHYQSEEPVIIILSARNEERLKEQAFNLKAYLEESKELNLYDVAYTLQVGRESMEDRLAIIAKDTAELIEQLSAYYEGKTDKIFTGNIKKAQSDFLLEDEPGRAYIQTAIATKKC